MFSTNKQKKGIALYFTLTVLSILTATLLAAVAVVVSQTKIIFSIGDSVVAFYAEDAGAEEALYKIYNLGEIPSDDWGTTGFCFPTQNVTTDTNYKVCISDDDINKIWSEGTYLKSNTKRKIELEISF